MTAGQSAESRDDRISDEAVAAAAEAIEASLRQYPITRNAFDARLGWGASVEEIAAVALAAAVPHLERQIRESIAGEIEARIEFWGRPGWMALADAAKIARGESS